MYPTVMPASDLKHCAPREIAEETLSALLSEMDLQKPLGQCGFLPQDLALLRRSLAQRGYAELDARRCQGEIHWVAFLGCPDACLTIIAELSDNTQLKKTWQYSAKSAALQNKTP